MSDELRQLAKSIVKESIIAHATERMLIQVVEVCSDHEKDAVKATRDENRRLRAALTEAEDILSTLSLSSIRGALTVIHAALKADEP